MLYPIILFTGATRLIRHNEYFISLKIGHALEVLSQSLPLLVLMKINNYMLQNPYSMMDKLFMGFSVLSIACTLFELIIESMYVPEKAQCLAQSLINRKSLMCEIFVAAVIGAVCVGATGRGFIN